MSRRPTARPAVQGKLIHALVAVSALSLFSLLGVACAGSVEDRLSEVRALQDAGQFSESVEPLREILAENPDQSEANYLLGVALVQTGQPSLAVWPLEKAAADEAHAVTAGLLLASTFLGLQSYDEALEAVNRVLETDPERVAALRVRAQALLGSNDREGALEDVERLLEIDPRDYQSVLMRATILAELGRLEESEAAHVELEEIAAEGQDPSLVIKACLARASFYEDNLKDAQRAETRYRECLEMGPTDPLALRLATRFFDGQGRAREATAIWERAVEEVPENLGFRAALASRYDAAGRSDDARALLMEGVELLGSAQAWHQLADYERRSGDSEAALAAVEKAVEAAPGRSENLLFLKADLLVDVGRYDEAETLASELSQPSFRDLIVGRVLLERGDAEGALAAFDTGLKRWPNNAGARFLAGLAARDAGDFARAKSELRESLRVDDQLTDAALVLAELHLAQGEYMRALEFSRNFVTKRSASRPEGYQVYIRAANAVGRYEASRTTVDALRDAGFPAQAAVMLAETEAAAAGNEAAVRAIRGSGLDLGVEENEPVLRALAEYLARDGHAERALSEVDGALEARPEASSLHELRAALLARLGRSDEARTAANRALELDSENGRAKAVLAQLAYEDGDLAKAIALYDEAAALLPEDPAPAFAAAQLSLARGDVADARQRLEAIVRAHPGHAGARNDLAWLLAEADEELDRALELARTAYRIDDSPAFADTLAWVHVKRDECEPAVELMEQAVSAEPESASMRYRFGVALACRGDRERALSNLKQAIGSGPFPEVEAARSEIARLEKP